MLGRPSTESISNEVKADHSVSAIQEAMLEELSERVADTIQRNVQHLEMVLPILNISKQKKDDINALILTAKALVE